MIPPIGVSPQKRILPIPSRSRGVFGAAWTGAGPIQLIPQSGRISVAELGFWENSGGLFFQGEEQNTEFTKFSSVQTTKFY